MGRKLPPDQMKLYKRIDEILLNDWDPIGVSAVPEARDEYYGYLPQVFRLVIEGASQSAIADYLFRVETESMGLTGVKEHCMKIAAAVLSAKREIGV